MGVDDQTKIKVAVKIIERKRLAMELKDLKGDDNENSESNYS